MRISLEQKRELNETEVLIRYKELSDQVRHIEALLYAINRQVVAKSDGRVYQLNPAEIYYIESVDKRTYLYSKKNVYEATEKLYQLEEQLQESGFVRVSKKCIVNKYMLEGIKILPNSHLEAMLTNGERILVTRNYITEIRKSLEEK